MNALQLVDMKIRQFVEESQDFAKLLWGGWKGLRDAWQYRRPILESVYELGASASWVLVISGVFIGLVLAMEWGNKLEQFGAKLLMGRIVSVGVIREIGPVVAGLLIAGRTGSKMAAEIGSMKVTDQIDALRAFGADPVARLVMPRQLASMFTLLPLTMLFDFMAILGGWVMAVSMLNTPSTFYWTSALDSLLFKDLAVGLIKPFVFGYIIASVAAHCGLRTEGGASGVGAAATRAVVYSSLSILVVDFILGKLILAMYG